MLTSVNTGQTNIKKTKTPFFSFHSGGVLHVGEQDRAHQALRSWPAAVEELVTLLPERLGDVVREMAREDLHQLETLEVLAPRQPGHHAEGRRKPAEARR